MRLMPVAAIIAVLSVIVVPSHRRLRTRMRLRWHGRPLDGAGNNVANPTWGQADRTVPAGRARRTTPTASARAGRRPARPLRQQPHLQRRRQNIFSEHGVTQWGFVWGQFLDHTFGLREETGGETAPIPFTRPTRWRAFTNDLGAIASPARRRRPGTGTSTATRASRSTRHELHRRSAVYGDTTRGSTGCATAPTAATLDPGAAAAAPRRPRQRRHRPGDGPRRPPAANPQGDGRRRRAGQREHRADRDPDAVRPRAQPDRRRAARAARRRSKFQIARRVVIAEQQYITYQRVPARDGRRCRGTAATTRASTRRCPTSSPPSATARTARSTASSSSSPTPARTRGQLDALEAPGRRGRAATATSVELAIPLNVAFFNPDCCRGRLGPMLQASAASREYNNDEQIDNQLRSVLFQVPGSGNPRVPRRPDPAGVLQRRGRPGRDRHRARPRPRHADLQRAAPGLRAAARRRRSPPSPARRPTSSRTGDRPSTSPDSLDVAGAARHRRRRARPRSTAAEGAASARPPHHHGRPAAGASTATSTSRRLRRHDRRARTCPAPSSASCSWRSGRGSSRRCATATGSSSATTRG